MLASLIQYAEELGYGCAIDFVKRCEDCGVGHQNSLHKKSLAADLHLYQDGTYITDWTGHEELHDFWDTLGGNERIAHDANHYSYGNYGGVR